MPKLNEQLLDLIKNYSGHLTAEDVFKIAKEKGIKVSLASVYRVLTNLNDQGQIRRISGVILDKDIYDKYTYSHGHLVCKKCGRISDINIEDFSKILEDKTGIKVDSYDLSINYICDDCKKVS